MEPARRRSAVRQGRWRETGKGYAIELRAPLNLFGTQLNVQALDEDNAIVAHARARLGAHGLRSLEAAAGAIRTGRRARFGRRHARLAAGAGRLAADRDADAVSRHAARRRGLHALDLSRVVLQRAARPRTYGLPMECGARRSMQHATASAARSGSIKSGGEPSLVRAAVPVPYGEENLGALVVELAGEQLVMVREIALTRLLNLTLVATLFAVDRDHRVRRPPVTAHSPLESRGEHGADRGRSHRAAAFPTPTRATSSARSRAATTRCSAA